MRIGHGFDAHAFEAGRLLWLGGIEVPHERGLAGHSDGDALIHAVIDALLGAAGLGDIGQLFPSSDERWRGVRSTLLLADVGGRLRQAGARPLNIDTTVVAEAPRLAPHVRAMRACIAETLGMDVMTVSVKPTTSDGMGFTGRGEGIAAFAAVLLE